MGCFLWGLIGFYEAQQGQGKAHEFIEAQMAEITELFFSFLRQWLKSTVYMGINRNWLCI